MFVFFVFLTKKSLLFVFSDPIVSICRGGVRGRVFFVFFVFGVELTIIIRALYQIEEPIRDQAKIHDKVIITRI